MSDPVKVAGRFQIPVTREMVQSYGEMWNREFLTFRDLMAPGEREALFMRFNLHRDTGGDWKLNPADFSEDVGLTRGHHSGDFPDCEDYEHNHCCRTCGRTVRYDP